MKVHERHPYEFEASTCPERQPEQINNQLAGLERRLAPEALGWASVELRYAQEAWEGSGNDDEPARSFLAHPNAIENIENLYAAYRRISGATTKNFNGMEDVFRTAKGTPVGETMHLVYVPWEQLLRTLTKSQGPSGIPDKWLSHMRTRSPAPIKADKGYGALMDQVRAGAMMYRTPEGGEIGGIGYLKARIEQEGNWGLILAQTTSDVGVVGPEWQFDFNDLQIPEDDSVASLSPAATPAPLYMNKVPSELQGKTMGGVAVTDMGVFEMTALTLGHDYSGSVSAVLSIRARQKQPRDPGSEILPANINPLQHTIPTVRAERTNMGPGLHWDTHYGEHDPSVDVQLRLCVVGTKQGSRSRYNQKSRGESQNPHLPGSAVRLLAASKRICQQLLD